MHIKEPATRISVCVLSESRLFREATSSWLVRLRRIQWVAAAGSMRQLQRQLGGRAADVLLAHARIEGALGTELLYDARTLFPNARLIVLQSRCCKDERAQWVDAGAVDYLQDSALRGDLLRSIFGAGDGCPRYRHQILFNQLRRGVALKQGGRDASKHTPHTY